MKQTMTPSNQIRKIHGLLAAAGLMHSKIDIIWETYGVEHVTDMTSAERDDFIQRLREILKSKNIQKASPQMRKLRSNVLRILDRMGIRDTQEIGVDHVPLDWKRVNAYLMDKRISGKLLYEHNEEELKELASKLRSIERKQKIARMEAEIRKDIALAKMRGMEEGQKAHSN